MSCFYRILFFLIFFDANQSVFAGPLPREARSVIEHFETVVRTKNTKELSALFAERVVVFQTMHGAEYEFHRSSNYIIQFHGTHSLLDIFFDENALRSLGYRSKCLYRIFMNNRRKEIFWEEKRNLDYEGTAVSATLVGYEDKEHDFTVYFKKAYGHWLIHGILISEGNTLNK